MFIIGIVSYVFIIIIEYGFIRIIKQFLFRCITKTYPPNMREDEDVASERERIKKMTPNELKSEILVMKNVSKYYGKFCAVNRLSTSIKK